VLLLFLIHENGGNTPEENMGDIVGDINRRRGQVNDMGDRAGAKTIKADAIIRNVWLCYRH
jgi:hypothetical protein